MSPTVSPLRLALRLALYFILLIGLIVGIAQYRPDLLEYLPVGGTDALEAFSVGDLQEQLPTGIPELESTKETAAPAEAAPQFAGRILLFLFGHLTGTVLVMIPITWTYRAMNHDVGYSKSFLRALIVLPVCATTIVLLIQDSLALAFGLAALVAAVRFRITLEEAMDGIFVFAAVCVGLAAGIGYLGIAAIMGAFFCFSNLIMWQMDYGRNPLDEARMAKKRAKLEAKKPDPGVRLRQQA